MLPHVFNYHQNDVTFQFFRFSYNIFTFTLRINWSSRSSKMVRLFSIQLLFSVATWIWSQSSKKTGLLMWGDLTYVRSQDPTFSLTGLHNKTFIELGSEAVVQRCSVTKGVLRNFAKFTGKHLCQSLFSIKLKALQLYQKRDSGTGAFLWILQNFLEHLLLQNTSGGCFCRLRVC